MKRPTWAALLLAGGASSRMGFPKALIDCAGRPLWRVQAGKLGALRPTERFLSTPAALELARTGAWKIIRDEKPGLGPLGGIDAARRAMKSEWLLVLAVDLAHMSTPYLRALREDAMTSGRGQVPAMDGFHLGLAAIYPRAWLDRQLPAHLASRDRSLQRLVRAGLTEGVLATRPAAKRDAKLFRNLNSPQDLLLRPR